MDADHHAKSGGAGEYLPPRDGGSFGLKVVPLLDKNGELNENFWNEARSVHRYCASVRFLAGTMKIPLAAHYYIHEDDPLRKQMTPFLRNDENIQSIKELFFSSFVEITGREQYLKYEPVSEILLRRIYQQHLAANLLLVYPMANGGEKNLASFYHKPFFAEEARSLICQISAAILDLYRCGTAHGDIKPENIMVSEIDGRKIFRLTDFGSAHFNGAASNTGTKSFFDRDLYEKIHRKTKSELTARVYTDFFALNHTLMSLVLGHHPDPDRYDNRDLVTDRWPEIGEQWEMLQDLDERTMDDFRKLAAEEPIAVNPDWEPFFSYCDEFDSVIQVNDTLEYGKLHEQITFSDQFDPLMKVRDIKFDREVWKLFPEFCHTPLTENPYEMIFHAPDDARTGQPPQDFLDYIPAGLANIRLTNEATERLIGYGKKLNEYFVENPGARACLPVEEDIFRCGGALKMIWGKKLPRLARPIDYAAYFRCLAAGQADFSADDWLTLLPLVPELKEKLDRKACLKLLKQYSSDSSCIWLFGFETFLEQISGEKFDFSPAQWLDVCGYTSRFDDRIDAAMAWKMFKTARRMTAMDLLKNHPHIAELLNSMPSPETDNELRVKDFLNLRKWDRETFLIYFPAGRRAVLTEKQWDKCLQVNPGLIEFVPEKTLLRLRRKTWVRILGSEPELIGKCPCAGRFSAAEWGSILLQQPQLKQYCPAGIVLPDRMKKRLDKKS